MFGQWLSTLISKSDHLSTVKIPDLIHSRESLQQILVVERMRSDRSERPFCLVSFNQSHHRPTAEAINTLLDVIQKSIRATDHAGFLGRYEVGVVLWNTYSQGAEQFAEKILKKLPEDLIPKTIVYTYPDDNKKHPMLDFKDDVTNADRFAEEASSLVTVGASEQCANTTSCNTTDRVEQTLNYLDQLIKSSKMSPRQFSAKPLSQLYVKRIPLGKRCLDLIGAGVGLLLLLPLLILSGLAIKYYSRGPIFFCQDRTGMGGRKFKMIKFRTMVIDAEAQKEALMKFNEQDGPAFKINRDPRITPIGRFLRAFSIDELPQLWNVIRGEMTLVGPRPLPCSETDACLGWQRRRLDVTPGLTCIWQIKDRRNKIAFADWVRMDIEYIGRQTIKQDLSLILQTVRTVVCRKGI